MRTLTGAGTGSQMDLEAAQYHQLPGPAGGARTGNVDNFLRFLTVLLPRKGSRDV